MITKIKNNLANYKYLLKAKFYLSKFDVFLLSSVSLLSLLLSFLVIYFSIPFLDVFLEKEISQQQKFTLFLSDLLKRFDLELSFKIVSFFSGKVSSFVVVYDMILSPFLFSATQDRSSNLGLTSIIKR